MLPNQWKPVLLRKTQFFPYLDLASVAEGSYGSLHKMYLRSRDGNKTNKQKQRENQWRVLQESIRWKNKIKKVWNDLDIIWEFFSCKFLQMLLQFQIPDFHFAIFNLSNQRIGPVSVQMPWDSVGVLAKLCQDIGAVHVTALPGACCHILEDQDTPLLPRPVIHLPSCKALLLSCSTSWFNSLGTAGLAADLPDHCLSQDLKQRQKCWAAQWDLLALWQGSERKGPKISVTLKIQSCTDIGTENKSKLLFFLQVYLWMK